MWKQTAGARYTDESKDFSGAYTVLMAGGVEAPLYPDVVEEFTTDNASGKLASTTRASRTRRCAPA